MACFVYMARAMQLRNFSRFFFGVIEHAEDFVSGLTPDSQAEFMREAHKYKSKDVEYSANRHFVYELMLSRSIETFDLYLLLVLREIFEISPEILKSETPIELSVIFEFRTFEEIISYAAERKLHELSFKSLSDLRKYISTRTGLELFKTEDIFATVLIATEVRNLIAHNDCRVNDVFQRRIKGYAKEEFPVSEMKKFIIGDTWLRNACSVLDTVAFDFDEAVAAKFKVRTLNRMTSFLYRD